MKFLLKELVNPNTDVLTDTQNAVLMMVHISTSPESAYSETNMGENMVVARQGLHRLGMVNISGEQLTITPKGTEMLEYSKLIDSSGMLTDEGQHIMDLVTDSSAVFNDQTVVEKFSFIASLL